VRDIDPPENIVKPSSRAGRALSRAVSHALRHEPWLYELEPDGEGWVSVEQLLDGLRRDARWAGLTRDDITEMLRGASHGRHELVEDRIRARYGHSVPVSLTPATPPPALIHGTDAAAVPNILSTGLHPMKRQYVHLSADRTMAWAVGRRKTGTAAVLVVDAARAHMAGVTFYPAGNGVWLTSHVPAQFIRVDSSDEAPGRRPLPRAGST
jgi:putative RNA 2'-phosphotransferase